jgi:hypothetical protein
MILATWDTAMSGRSMPWRSSVRWLTRAQWLHTFSSGVVVMPRQRVGVNVAHEWRAKWVVNTDGPEEQAL